jgi:hypothetical protein
VKLFVSHSWEDAPLVDELKWRLQAVSIPFEITSVERTNPIKFPNGTSEGANALEEIDKSICELARRDGALKQERSELEQARLIIKSRQYLAQDENLAGLLKRLERRMMLSAGVPHSKSFMDSKSGAELGVSMEEELKSIDSLLAENEQRRDSTAVSLSKLNSAKVEMELRLLRYQGDIEFGVVSPAPDQYYSDQFRRDVPLDFDGFASMFGKFFGYERYRHLHPSFRNAPTALLSALAYRLYRSDAFIILYTDRFMFSPWCHLELDICYKVRLPSICIDVTAEASAPSYLRLTDHYCVWSDRTELALRSA